MKKAEQEIDISKEDIENQDNSKEQEIEEQLNVLNEKL